MSIMRGPKYVQLTVHETEGDTAFKRRMTMKGTIVSLVAFASLFREG